MKISYICFKIIVGTFKHRTGGTFMFCKATI